jgi:hypothetical protein
MDNPDTGNQETEKRMSRAELERSSAQMRKKLFLLSLFLLSMGSIMHFYTADIINFFGFKDEDIIWQLKVSCLVVGTAMPIALAFGFLKVKD